MHKTKVLWIMTGGLRRNGICVSQLDYARTINKNKFVLDIAAVHDNSSDMIKAYEEAGCRVIIFPDRRKNLNKYKKTLKKLIEEEKYDVVHTFGSSALMGIELKIAKKCGVEKRIAHSRNTTCDRKLLEKLLRPGFNKSYNYALACGKDAGDWLFDNKKYVVLHNGKDLKKYSFNKDTRNNIRKKYNIGKKIAYGHVGNFNNQKNHEFLIDIFKEIYNNNHDSLLFLMGNGPKMDEIKEKVDSLSLSRNVIFLGSVDNVHEIIQGMDIMLFPSLFEGLPNVVIEWQASGLPCVLSDKITDECKVSDLVLSTPIDKGTVEWIKAIDEIDIDKIDREKESKRNCKLLKENGFDLGENTLLLEKIYMEKNGCE